MVTVVDLNVPLAKSKEKMEELCQLLQFTNDLAPSRHIGVIELPETAKKVPKEVWQMKNQIYNKPYGDFVRHAIPGGSFLLTFTLRLMPKRPEGGDLPFPFNFLMVDIYFENSAE